MVTLNLRGRLVNSRLSRMQVVELVDDRRGVEQLVRRQAGHRAAADAADVVHAGLLAVQADLLEPPPDLRHVAEREPAQLDLLPRRQVAEALAELVGQVGDDAELPGVGLAGVQAQAQHEVARASACGRTGRATWPAACRPRSSPASCWPAASRRMSSSASRPSFSSFISSILLAWPAGLLAAVGRRCSSLQERLTGAAAGAGRGLLAERRRRVLQPRLDRRDDRALADGVAVADLRRRRAGPATSPPATGRRARAAGEQLQRRAGQRLAAP